MKLVKIMTAFAAVFALTTFVATAELTDAVKAKAKKNGCCEKAFKAGKECPHKCCAEAAKEGKLCEKCNAPAKKAPKKKKD